MSSLPKTEIRQRNIRRQRLVAAGLWKTPVKTGGLQFSPQSPKRSLKNCTCSLAHFLFALAVIKCNCRPFTSRRGSLRTATEAVTRSLTHTGRRIFSFAPVRHCYFPPPPRWAAQQQAMPCACRCTLSSLTAPRWESPLSASPPKADRQRWVRGTG